MAKSHGFVKGDLKGNAGTLAFRQQGGQTIVSGRIYNNKSAGDGASYAQRVQRCRLANIVNFYKVIRQFEAKAWENKGARVSDYNMFAQKNLPTNDVYLPKTYANVGSTVVARYMVSQGSLPQVAVTLLDGPAITNIDITGLTIQADTTVGALSQAIIDLNKEFLNGDKLTFAVLRSQPIVLAGASLPGLVAEYIEFNLNVDSTDLVQSVLSSANAAIVANNNKLALQFEGSAMMVVHTREISGRLYTSTQYVVLPAVTSSNPYGTEQWIEKCAASYGYAPTVLIQPESEADVVAGTTYYSVSGYGVGHGTISGTGRYAEGSDVVLSAVADSGYVLKGWYDNESGEGEALSTSQQYTISNIQANTVVYAIFEEAGANQVTITATVSGEGGTVTGGGTYEIGQTVTLTAVENDGFQFMGWSDGNSSNPRTFTATTDLTVSASFLDLTKI